MIEIKQRAKMLMRERTCTMNKIDEIVSATKLHEMLHKKEDNKAKSIILWVLAIVGVVAAVGAIAYGVYRFFAPDYLEDFEEEFDDDFDDDYFEESEI